MRILYLLEFVFGAGFIYFVYSQIVLPLWRDTPLFPWLETEGRLIGKLKDTKQELVETELEQKIRRIKELEKELKKGRV